MPGRRPFCSDVSREGGEPMWATASRIDHWFLVEYRGVWARDALSGSTLGERVKAHLRDHVAAAPASRVVFIRHPNRRRHDRLVAYAATSRSGEERLVRHEFDAYEDLLELDLRRGAAAAVPHPLFLVCTHGKHDPCCARHGRPLFAALADELDDEWVWQSSHVGGDRFAGNLVCLPEGLFYGEVARADALTVLDEHLAGRVHLPHYRGRSSFSMAVQAAERAVREHAGLAAIGSVTLERIVRRNGGWTIRMAGYEVDVAAVEGELTFLTCNAGALTRPRRFVARAVRRG